MCGCEPSVSGGFWTPQVFTPQSEWKIVENTHEAIIDQETFDVVQTLAKARSDAYQARLGRFDDMGGSPCR